METILIFMSSVFCLVTTIVTLNNVKKSREIINRQKAENDSVKKESDEWSRRFINRCRDYEFEIQENEKLKAEVERLNEENEKQKIILEGIEDAVHPLPFETDYDKAIKQAKIEAVREFAEEFVLSLPLTPLTLGYARVNVSQYLKKMEGDGDA